MRHNRTSVRTYLYWGKNLISVLYSKLLLLLGHKYSATVIPHGAYCYTPDIEKNKTREFSVYYIIPCKYYKTIGERWNGCKYLGLITDDFIFADQCKLCGENNDFNGDDI